MNISLFIQLQEDLAGHQAARSFGVSDFLLHNHIAAARKLFFWQKFRLKLVWFLWLAPVSTNEYFHMKDKKGDFIKNCRPAVVLNSRSHANPWQPWLWLSKCYNMDYLEVQWTYTKLLIAKSICPEALEDCWSRKTWSGLDVAGSWFSLSQLCELNPVYRGVEHLLFNWEK